MDPTGKGREYVNWVSDDEEETENLYGKEIYLVFDIPRNWLIRGSHGFFVPKPIGIERVRKLVISEKYSDKIPEIRELLKRKGIKNLEIEVKRERKGLEKILSVVFFFFAFFLLFMLIRAEITAYVVGYKDSKNLSIFFILLIVGIAIIFVRKYYHNKRLIA